MHTIRFLITAITLSTLLVASTAFAGTYFGLTPGKTTFEAAPEIIQTGGGTCNSTFGYKGYRDLPIIKVISFKTFEKFGELHEAWLHFTPSDILHQIHVSWFDAGRTFKTVKDALDSKYGVAGQQGFGFRQEYTYQDGETSILLVRNTFGFGRDQKTSITYTYNPTREAVKAMQDKIETDIRRKNAAAASGDL